MTDNDDGSAYYYFENPITVEPNVSFTDMMFEVLATKGAGSPEVAAMFTGSAQDIIQSLTGLSAALNVQSKLAALELAQMGSALGYNSSNNGSSYNGSNCKCFLLWVQGWGPGWTFIGGG